MNCLEVNDFAFAVSQRLYQRGKVLPCKRRLEVERSELSQFLHRISEILTGATIDQKELVGVGIKNVNFVGGDFEDPAELPLASTWRFV